MASGNHIETLAMLAIEGLPSLLLHDLESNIFGLPLAYDTCFRA
jgi:hypothetical protein